MEVVELKVQVDKSQLTALDKEINALKSKTIKISVDASGFNALNKSTLQSMRSVTQYVNAVSRAQAQENKLSLAREKTAQATQRRITSENRLAAQIEKTKTTQAQATAQAEKTAQAQARLQTQIERTRTAQAQYATQAEKTATAQAKAATQTEKVSKSTSLLGDSLGNVALKMAAWQVMGDLVATPIRALKEALSTMKDVDTELVNIQKVTGNTGTEMEALSERAFQMASEYGRTATEVTQAMTEFARAGYGDQLEQMAEMSILLQNIGDVSSETANSMLLAVDAAWGFGGSEEKLMSVMDGLNEITNKNATDMDKLATGMTVAASVFAESGESVQTFASMLGTGTAVTQRSGSEIARGLRTIMMNIRQIRGETEDGELIDGESIANASKALKEFAGISTMENGELRLASDVLDELADKWDNLNTVQQSAIAEALAGKRQANVLTSLIANWDMVEKQMKEYAAGAGSAMKENEIYMDSWEAKLNQLSSKWTEFISHLVKTDAIKVSLDGLTGFISALDTDVGHAVINVSALALALTGLVKVGNLLKSTKLVETIAGIGDAFKLQKTLGAMEGVTGAKGTLGALGGTLTSIGKTLTKSPVVWAAAIAGVVKIIDLATTSFEEQSDKVSELVDQYNELNDAEGELAALRQKSSSGESLTQQEERRLAVLEAQNKTLEKQIKLEQDKAAEIWQQQYGSREQAAVGDRPSTAQGGASNDVVILNTITKAQEKLNDAFFDGAMSEEEFRNGLSEIVAASSDYYDSLKNLKEGGYELTDAQEQFIEKFDLMSDQLANTEDGMMQVRLTLENFTKAWEATDFSSGVDLGKTVVNIDALKEALENAGASAEEIQTVLDNMARDDAIIEFSVEGDAEEAISALEELGIAIESEDGKTITINYDDFISMGQEIGLTMGQMEQWAIKAESLGNINFADAEGKVINLKEQILGLGDLKIDFNIPMQGLQNAANEADNVEQRVTDLGHVTAKPTVEVQKDQAMQAISSVTTALRQIPRFVPVTVTVSQVGSVPKVAQNAGGDPNFKGGLTLLGDERSPSGAPKPELVITEDRAFLTGLRGPELRNLPRGAQIFSNKDTKEILARGSGDDSFPAFASGSVNLYKYWGNKKNNSSQSKGSGGGSSAGKRGTSSKASTSRSRSKSSGSGSSKKDSRQEELEKQVDLLKSELDLMEAQGKPASELAKKMGEIQGALHTQADYMRSIGADQADINKLSKEWWDIREDIKQAYQEEMEETRDALQEEFDLIEHQNGPTEKRIDLLKKVQDSLHQEAEFLRSIGADQKEINELSNEWWEIHQDILSVQEDLWSELEDAVDQELERAAEARDLELDALDKELERLDAEREAKEEKLELEEKTLAVQEAQAALANAQNERTIRTYNAASGQWEWVADADTVKDAEEALEDAQEDLEDYKEDLEYQAAVDAIEARREAIEKAYENLEEGWEDIIDSVQEPTRSISEILADLAQNGTPLMKQQVDNVGKLLGDLNNYIRGAIGSETGESYYGGGGTPSMDFSHDTTDYHALMERASDEAEFNHWAKLREEKMKAQGIDPEASGLKTNAQIYEEWKNKNKGGSSGGGGSSSGGSSSGGGKVVGSVNGKAPPGLSTGDKVVTQGGTYEITGVNKDGSYTSNKVSDQTKSDYESSGGKYDKYDSGGVLRGLGGIKATEEDEMILPPDITAAMLTPAADATFQARLAELGVLYGAKRGPLTLPTGMSQNRDSHDHHGDSYTFGDVTLTEEQARGMTVYDLAQKSRSLGLYGWRH